MKTIDEVYRRRAEQLARRPASGAVATTLGILVLQAGAERYAIELSALAEIFPYRGCTPVPGAPPALLGVMNVRGDLRPVADLGRLLGLPPGGTGGGYVVMLRRQDSPVGLRIDTIEGVRLVDPATLVRAGSGPANIRASRLVKAITADTVILIDTHAALAGLGLTSSQSDAKRSV
jgi:chemotaxis signal transduction protein